MQPPQYQQKSPLRPGVRTLPQVKTWKCMLFLCGCGEMKHGRFLFALLHFLCLLWKPPFFRLLVMAIFGDEGSMAGRFSVNGPWYSGVSWNPAAKPGAYAGPYLSYLIGQLKGPPPPPPQLPQIPPRSRPGIRPEQNFPERIRALSTTLALVVTSRPELKCGAECACVLCCSTPVVY